MEKHKPTKLVLRAYKKIELKMTLTKTEKIAVRKHISKIKKGMGL